MSINIKTVLLLSIPCSRRAAASLFRKSKTPRQPLYQKYFPGDILTAP